MKSRRFKTDIVPSDEKGCRKKSAEGIVVIQDDEGLKCLYSANHYKQCLESSKMRIAYNYET